MASNVHGLTARGRPVDNPVECTIGIQSVCELVHKLGLDNGVKIRREVQPRLCGSPVIDISPLRIHEVTGVVMALDKSVDKVVVVKHQNELQIVRAANFEQEAATVLENANDGIQTKVVDSNGRVRAVIGLNGTRYLPNPDPDPLDEILSRVLETANKERT